MNIFQCMHSLDFVTFNGTKSGGISFTKLFVGTMIQN